MATKKAVKKAAKKAPAKKTVAKKTAPKKAVPKKAVTKKIAVKKKAAPAPAPRAKKVREADFSAFPPEAIKEFDRDLCLACVLDVFTRVLKLPAKTAQAEVRRYTPTLEELSAEIPARPFFHLKDEQAPCPFCGAAAKWHARIRVHRIESGKATDAMRRELIKSLPEARYSVVEEKSTRQAAFFDWLEGISKFLDLESPRWPMDLAMHYLSRKEPKEDWAILFAGITMARRSRRLTEGWECEHGKLYLAPMLFDELILVQYLVSRSHHAGGTTFEGRYTLAELFARLRNSGYLRHVGVSTGNVSDALEQLVEVLGGGEGAMRFYYVIDRGEFLEHVEKVAGIKPPRAKKPLAE